MAEIGSGKGSTYPTELDVDNIQESTSTPCRAAPANDLATAIVNIETELGTDPAGNKTDLKTRLAVLFEDDGTIKIAGVDDDTLDHAKMIDNSAAMNESAQLDIVADTATILTYATEVYDESDEHTSGTGFTADTTGIYFVSATLWFNEAHADGEKYYMTLENDGTIEAISQRTNSGATAPCLNIATIMKVTATKVIRAKGWHTAAAGNRLTEVNTGNQMTVFRLM